MQIILSVLQIVCLYTSICNGVSLFRHRKIPTGAVNESVSSCIYVDHDKYICDEAFSYDKQSCYGPENWYKISSCFLACDGDRQSPINIDHSWSTFHSHLQPIVLAPKYTKVETTISNNGNHAPEFDARDLSPPAIQLHYPFSAGSFDFKNVHIHLGQHSNVGSEHTMNGRHSPMEAHLVFYNIDAGDQFAVVKNLTNGLMVISVFIEVADERVVGWSPTDAECQAILQAGHPAYDECYNRHGECIHGECYCWKNQMYSGSGSMESESNEKQTESRCSVRVAKRLSDILECSYRNRKVKQFDSNQEPSRRLHVEIRPEDVLPCGCDRRYYTYEGSLTTPPCTENVQWIVMRCPITVSKQVLKDLQAVEASNDGKVLKTDGLDRPLQNLNGRQILRNFLD